MSLLALIAASYTFTATATGLEKGAPVEFMFAAKGSDYEYETLFTLTKGIDEICNDLEKAGLPRGKAADLSRCIVWPVGCPVRISPKLEDFLDISLPEGYEKNPFIYTGGSRDGNGKPVAAANMPMALMALYSLSQSPFVFNGIYEQGMVYNSFKSKKTLKKGTKVDFTVSWDKKDSPRSMELEIFPGKTREVIDKLKAASGKTDLDVKIVFNGELTLSESIAAAKALDVIDCRQIKINGCAKDSFFYRAFLPLEKWRERRERLVQPFEYTLGENDRLVFIEEDWKVEGLDPKLSERPIAFTDTAKYQKTDTCFIYADKDMKISRIKRAADKLDTRYIVNWYILVK